MQASSVRARPRRHPLAAVIALALAGAPLTVAYADTLPVTSCADDGSPGTLRSVVASARNGDTIDMTHLTCGTITLAQGGIDTGDLLHLTLAGPGRDILKISGGNASGILYVQPFETNRFTLRDLTLAHGLTGSGKYAGAACLADLSGTVLLERVTLADCHQYGYSGGAIAANNITLIDSAIIDSSVQTTGNGSARGGGASASSLMTLIRSTVSGNAAIDQTDAYYAGGGGLSAYSLIMIDSTVSGNATLATDAGQNARGGGVYVKGVATILRSAITGNTADGDGGGLFKGDAANGGTTASFTIQDSTLADNSAGGSGGGLYGEWPVTIANSTIAGNTSALGGAVRLRLYWRDYYGDYHVRGWPDFESSIIAANTAAPEAVYATDLSADAVLTAFGANNLIGDTDVGITLPPDSMRGNPYLGPLADHGGRSQTMAPLTGSPVIDTGFNPLGFNADQRGPGFVRVSGMAADIGAYEVQPRPVPGFAEATDPVMPVSAANRAPTSLQVTSCADDGTPGTLRSVAATALDGDTIDMTKLTCSTITLAQGPIAIGILGPHAALTSVAIAGPGKDALTISGNGTSAVFQLGGPSIYGYPGTITLAGLTIAHGAKYDTAACISGFSSYLVLDNVDVTDCHTRNAGGGAWGSGHGGGAVSGFNVQVGDSTISDSSVTAIDRNVAVGGGLWASIATLTSSTIRGNSASAPVEYAYQGYRTAGGGVYVARWAYVSDSTISGNSVEATESGQNANGGGLATRAGLTVSGSTFDGNTADGIGGGAIETFPHYLLPLPDAPMAMGLPITNSTFTGNIAGFGGALACNTGTPISNSTIAFNASTNGGAVAIVDGGTALENYTLYLNSTIIAKNTIDGTGGHAADLAINPKLTLTVIGANNLVGSADPNVTLPPDTLGSDPLLLPLADNGGPTWTMALAPGSPAIDAGSNPLAFDSDQRGQGYARVYGFAADIGAYEVQPAGDVIFTSGFDD